MATAKKAAPKKAVSKTVVKRAKKATAKKAAPAKGRYHYQVEMNGEVHTGSTDAIARSLEALRPDRHNTRLVARYSLKPITPNSDAKVVEYIHTIPIARRMMANTMAADIFEKRVKMALGDYHV